MGCGLQLEGWSRAGGAHGNGRRQWLIYPPVVAAQERGARRTDEDHSLLEPLAQAGPAEKLREAICSDGANRLSLQRTECQRGAEQALRMRTSGRPEQQSGDKLAGQAVQGIKAAKLKRYARRYVPGWSADPPG